VESDDFSITELFKQRKKQKRVHLLPGFGKEELPDLSEPKQKDSRCN
jgi:hypothetical protein